MARTKPARAFIDLDGTLVDSVPELAWSFEIIGDAVSAVKSIRAAEFQSVFMSYGYNHGNNIRLANPDAVIDSFAGLNTLY